MPDEHIERLRHLLHVQMHHVVGGDKEVAALVWAISSLKDPNAGLGEMRERMGSLAVLGALALQWHRARKLFLSGRVIKDPGGKLPSLEDPGLFDRLAKAEQELSEACDDHTQQHGG